jgi:hypothetical protein
MEDLPSKIEIEHFKGSLPNFITSRTEIARIRKQEVVDAANEKRPERPVIFCQYCGRREKNMQGLRRHLGFCLEKRKMRDAKFNGVDFIVAGYAFRVRTDRVKLLLALEGEEQLAAHNMEAGVWDEKNALLAFQRYLLGAANSLSCLALSFEILPPGKEPRSAVSGGDVSPAVQNAGADGGTVPDPNAVVESSPAYSQE